MLNYWLKSCTWEKTYRAVCAARLAAARRMQGSLSCGDCAVYQDLFMNKLETEQYSLKKLAKNK